MGTADQTVRSRYRKSTIAMAITIAIVSRRFQSALAFVQTVQPSFVARKAVGGFIFMPKLSPVHQLRSSATSSTDAASSEQGGKQPSEAPVPLYRSEGLFAVEKPLEWTSQDVVAYIRGILERDARSRGAKPAKVGSRRRNKSRILRVGHGGTLDPLATGVLVIGVGKGTKELQGYLSGSKRYIATAELGFETTTLDMEGNVTKQTPFDHVTLDSIEKVLPEFLGKTLQVPPIFSAIRKGGKKLYQEARKGKTADDLEIEPREVEVYSIELIHDNQHKLPKFKLDIECGGGTYVRSIVRDVGYKLNTVATMTSLARIKQGQFTLDNVLQKDQWTADNIYEALDHNNESRLNSE